MTGLRTPSTELDLGTKELGPSGAGSAPHLCLTSRPALPRWQVPTQVGGQLWLCEASQVWVTTLTGHICFSAEVKVVGMEGTDKLAILRGCPGLPGPPGPKGEAGAKGERGVCGPGGGQQWGGRDSHLLQWEAQLGTPPLWVLVPSRAADRNGHGGPGLLKMSSEGVSQLRAQFSASAFLSWSSASGP